MIFDTFALGSVVRGCLSQLISILFLVGIQVIGIGVPDEYKGRIYLETKAKPKYIL